MATGVLRGTNIATAGNKKSALVPKTRPRHLSYEYCFLPYKDNLWISKMIHQLKAHSAKPDNLHLIPRTPVNAEGDVRP